MSSRLWGQWGRPELRWSFLRFDVPTVVGTRWGRWGPARCRPPLSLLPRRRRAVATFAVEGWSAPEAGPADGRPGGQWCSPGRRAGDRPQAHCQQEAAMNWLRSLWPGRPLPPTTPRSSRPTGAASWSNRRYRRSPPASSGRRGTRTPSTRRTGGVGGRCGSRAASFGLSGASATGSPSCSGWTTGARWCAEYPRSDARSSQGCGRATTWRSSR